MLRHPALIPLSHQHQHALALCVLIERRKGSVEELARKAADLAAIELQNHFDLEERILFPAVREKLGPLALVEELVAEHRRLEALVQSLPDTLGELAQALRAHIQREEKELFEEIQGRLDEKTLQNLKSTLEAEAVRVCL
jgi:hemerythrin-like domain-containing protein